MIRLALLLIGARALRGGWPVILFMGVLAAALGLVILADAVDGVTFVATRVFGYLLILVGATGLFAAFGTARPSRRLEVVRSVLLVVLGLLVVDVPWPNGVANSILFGLAFIVDGAARITTATIIRYPGWRVVIAGGIVELGLAALCLTSWPVSYERTVPFCIGVFLLLSAWSAIAIASRLRSLPENGSVMTLPGFIRQGWYAGIDPTIQAPDPNPGSPPLELTVRVWTPSGSAEKPTERRLLVDRYIAAIDTDGRVSTGHAAMEMPPELYVSHYRGEEANRDTSDFIRDLRVSPENVGPGRFLASYPEEVASWCEADGRVTFRRFDAQRLRNHWAQYSRDSSYSLGHRNCSVAVALALNAALEGTCDRGPVAWRFLRLLATPDLWQAATLRHRAEVMTWTPGLILDYASALQRVVDGPNARR